MGGRVKAHKRLVERDIILAYNTGAFSRASGKSVKPLDYYLRQIRGSLPASAPSSAAISFFHSMKARGIPVSIERVPKQTE